jgi:phenylalanyl-tRNA synthetase beta chain
MLFSRDWLAEYVPLPEPPREVARRLTLAGLAVEGIQETGIEERAGASGDAILDIDVTTNRPDCMNHLGVARELAVVFERTLQPPSFALPERLGGPAVEVEVEDEAACPRYVGRVVSGVAVGASPEWLQRRLSSIGLRSINNVVDVTNFVLWELGQPLHAYDLAKLGGGRIVVRRARAGERLTTLDGAVRELGPEILVIADARAPVGLAGVMGGADSEVTGSTVDILLEGAHFDRRAVRTTARRFGLHTDASHRFERGTDPEICLAAVDRAAALIAQLAGGTVAAVAADRRARPSPPRRGRLDLARLDAFAGVAIPPAEVLRILSGLGFHLSPIGGDGGPVWEVTVPSWRLYDFEPRPWVPGSNRHAAEAGAVAEVYPQDLYEEVMRIHGYERIPAALPAIPGPDGHPNRAAARRRRIRRHLAACGYAEAIHFAFGDRAEALALPSVAPGAVPIELANPLSERASVLRRSLVPGLVESARFNQRRGAAAVRLFEVATVFLPRSGGDAGEAAAADGTAELPEQPEMVALVCGGTVGNPWQREVHLDLFDAKGAVESLAAELGARVEARPPGAPGELPGLLAGSSAWLYARGGERPVGYLGRVEAEEGFPLYVAEIAADALEGEVDRAVRLPPRLPGIGADLTLTHALDVPWAEIERKIAALAPPDLASRELANRYRGEGVPEGAVNTTIHFVYNAGDRTLTQDEVNERQAELAAELVRRFGWRGKE